MVIDGLKAEQLPLLGEGMSDAKWMGERLIIRMSPDRVAAGLQAALAQSARIVSINPVRYSLEEMFIDEIRKRGGSGVGGVET